MPITVNRGGVSSRDWYESGLKADATSYNDELKIRFELDSKGGGRTDVMVNIDKDSYAKLIGLMFKCDFERTITAFGSALVERAQR